MDPLEAAFMDELLLDFSADPSSLLRHRVPGASPPPETVKDFVEEDLEWISNKDAFPALDTLDPSAARKPSPPPSAAGSAPLPAAAAPFLLRAPGRARSEGRRRRRQVVAPAFLRPLEGAGAGEERGEPAPAAGGAAFLRPAEEPAARRCWHCEAEETPQWRAGPGGPKTLCNACGVRYKSGRLVPEYRPTNSPTFSGELHSSSHRKIMDMRRRKEGLVPLVAAAVGPAPAKEVKKKKRVSFAAGV